MANSYSSVTNQTGALLKRFYAAAVVDQLNEDLPVYKMAEKIKDKGQGDGAYITLRLNRNQGVGFGADGGAMPPIGAQSFQQAKLDWKYAWLRCGITAGMIAASKSNVGAFVEGLDAEIQYGYKDFKNEFNRALVGDGTGTLGTLSAAVVASNTISVVGPYSAGTANADDPGNRFIFPNAVIDIYSTAGVLKASSVTVTAVTGTTTATVTLDQAVTAAATDIIVRSGSYGYELQGLYYALDGGTSTIYNINRATYPQYQGNVLSLSNGQLTLDQMQRAWNEGMRRGGIGVGKYQALLCDFPSSRYIQKLCTADKRYVNTQKLDGGAWEKTSIAMEFNGLPLIIDKDHPTKITFVPVECLAFYILQEMTIADEWGGQLFPDAEADKFELRMRMFGNLFNKQPSAFGTLTNYISP